jgi:outer membrane protein OmpA-like peptidoglycan-associated protein
MTTLRAGAMMAGLAAALSAAAASAMEIVHGDGPRWDLQTVMAAPPPEDPYDAALRDGFAALSQREIEAVDWRDARRFLRRAQAAAQGAPLPPEDPATRRLTEDQAAVFALRRNEVAQLILNPGARARAAEEIAALHLAYDAWLEAVEFGQPPGRPEAAEDAYLRQREITFDKAEFPANVVIVLPPAAGDVGGVTVPGDVLDAPYAAAEIDAQGRATRTVVLPEEVAAFFAEALAAEPTPPAEFALPFRRGSTRLDAAALATVAEAVVDIAERGAPEVLIEGHASPDGPASANRAISRRRALNTRAALTRTLRAAGMEVPPIAIQALGETEPLSEGPEDYALDRRAVIVVR